MAPGTRTALAALTAVVLSLPGALLPATADPVPERAPQAPVVQRCAAGHVALTFDDGPSPTVTPQIVELLERWRVPATFFMVGSRVRQYPDVARQVAEAGFTIGNHTDDHVDLTDLTRREIRATLRRTETALHDAGVGHVSRFVRPPYGATDDRVAGVLAATGRVMALWNVDSRDWDGLTPRAIRRTTIAQVADRGSADSVVLHHDGVANSEATLAALPSEIRRLRAAGYCFTPLPPSGLE